MKKTVLALAAIAASSAAFAQSSVTLYGVVDASVESVKGDKSLTRVASDNLASSRIGFKGVEDLGGGLKANFLLEASTKVDAGTADTTRFFGRSAWAGLAGGFGEVRIGRQDSLIGAQIANTIGAQAYDASVIAGTLGGATYRRIDNALTYVAPTFLPGLTLAGQFSTAVGVNSATAETTPGNNADRGFGLSANYANGPVAGGLSYIQVNSDAKGDIENTGLYLYGAFDAGVAKLTAFYNDDTQDSKSKDGRRLYGIQAGVPVAPGVTITGAFSYAHNVSAIGASFAAKNTRRDDARIVSLRAQYDLSKRTALYGLFTQVQNGDQAALNVSSVTTSKDQGSRGLAVGVRHSF